ncbi:MAG: DJ-1/PfpI family protein, partial [Acidimicrobiia bacterium]
MPRLLMVVSSAKTLTLAEGTPHPTGYWAEEVEKPYLRFVEQGVDVVVATPDGQAPQPDPYGLEPIFHYPDDDEDFAGSVFRSFAPDVDDIRLTLHQLTELNLMAARRVFQALRDAGLSAAEARGVVESCARRAWAQDRDFIEVLAEEPVVAGNVPIERLEQAAADLRADSEVESRRVATTLASIEALQRPKKLSDISDDEALTFDAIFFPGGHGPMVDLHENPDVDRLVRLLHERDRTVAALCHGPAALLSVGEGHEGWLFDGYKMTAFTDEEEDQTQAGRLGMPWYLETALKNVGAVFDDGDSAWASHIVVDRNLVTAQNPAS